MDCSDVASVWSRLGEDANSKSVTDSKLQAKSMYMHSAPASQKALSAADRIAPPEAYIDRIDVSLSTSTHYSSSTNLTS